MISVKMPRDLMQARKAARYAAVVAVGFDADRSVFRLGTAENVENYLDLMQGGTWHQLQFVRVVWTPGLALARTIATTAETFLRDIGNHLGHHWYRAELELLDDLVRAEVIKRNAPTWSHPELIQELRAKQSRLAANFAQGRL